MPLLQPQIALTEPRINLYEIFNLDGFKLLNENKETLNEVNLTDEDETLESDWHVGAMTLLINILRDWWEDCDDIYVSGNTAVYFDPQHTKRNRGPDLYVVKNTKKKPRQSWLTWEENGLTPNFILELASPSTAQFDLTGKKDIYEQQLKVPEYTIYNPATNTLHGWRLQNSYYAPIIPNIQRQLWCQELGLWLGIAAYNFKDGAGVINTPRFFDHSGQLLLTEAERKAYEAATAKQQAALEAQRAERLAQHLRTLGINPDNI